MMRPKPYLPGTAYAARMRIAVVVVVLFALALALFIAFEAAALFSYRPFDWWMAPEINAGDLVFGMRTRHPHPGFGDTVIYVPPTRSYSLLIGRIAGIPGDGIVIDGGHLYRNESDVTFFHGPLPVYTLQVAGAGIMLGDAYLIEGVWPAASRWTAPNRIPDDCYLILANDTAAVDSHRFGLVPGSADGPCASSAFPAAHIVSRVINTWRLGISHEDFLARQRAVR